MTRLCLLVLALVASLAPAAGAADAVDTACRTAPRLRCKTYYADADRDGYGDPATAHRALSKPKGEVTRSGDCDDRDATVHPGAVEGYDGRDQDCDGAADEPVLVVSELMVNPKAVADTAGEWLEIANASDEPVLLAGVSLIVGTKTCELPHEAAAGQRIVVARSADTAANGGVTPDVTCAISLTNSGGSVRLQGPAADLDAVDSTGWTIPDGASLSLRDHAHASAANDAPDAWCAASSVMPGGDRGTPGASNDPCPDPPA